MPSEALQWAYARTDYRVRLPAGGAAHLQVGHPLPTEVMALLPDRETPWAFITAWNPRSTPRPRSANRAAQRQLLAALRSGGAALIRAAEGVGIEGWREASLFAAPVGVAALDRLLEQFDQHAAVAGRGAGVVRLHWHP